MSVVAVEMGNTTYRGWQQKKSDVQIISAARDPTSAWVQRT